MADIRNPVGGSPLTPAARPAPARSDAVRAAQKAFFEAALSGAAAAPPTLKPAPAPVLSAARLDAQPAPTRLLRPGSLIDIKV